MNRPAPGPVIDPDTLWTSRIQHLLRAVAVFGAMALLLGLLGWLIAGWAGVVWSLGFGIALALGGCRYPPRMALQAQGGMPLPPRQAPALYDLVTELARRAGLDAVPTLYYVPSRMLNAFAVGSPRDSGIAVTEGLLRHLSLRELAGVLAHEISHIRSNDVWLMSAGLVVSQMTVWLATFGQIALLLSLPWMLQEGLAGVWALLLAVVLAPSAATLLYLALSRSREFSADLEAVALTADPEGLASALAVLERHHGSWLESVYGRLRSLPPHPWLRTHPPTEDRIRALLALQRRPAYPAVVTADTRAMNALTGRPRSFRPRG